MFTDWGADGLKVDHMCQGSSCGTGAQGHMIAVEFQQPTIERWVSAIAAVNKTESVLFQVRDLWDSQRLRTRFSESDLRIDVTELWHRVLAVSRIRAEWRSQWPAMG